MELKARNCILVAKIEIMVKVREKLECILLVDDDEATNFIHSLVIKKMACAKEIVTRENGLKALDYLKNSGLGDFHRPDLILLDINMPHMNGWEFLEAYKSLDENQRAKAVIVMLTSPLGPDLAEKAKEIPNISGFMQKPLTTESMEGLLKHYFD
ncbi:MAG: response regulator [Maribacter sp.]|nr:response regulator [Maribacter sp.]